MLGAESRAGGSQMAALKVAVVAVIVVLTWLAVTVVRLENYRYANSLGMCDVAGVSYANDTVRLGERERCLHAAKSRSSGWLHLYYALTRSRN